MKIQVSFQNEFLGSGIFWKGISDDINSIRNIPARNLAKQVIKDGVTRQSGMWTVKVIEDD